MAHNWKLQLQQALNPIEIINDLAWLLVNIGVVNDPSEVNGISYTTPDGVTFSLGQQMKNNEVLFVLQIDGIGSERQYRYLPSTDNDMTILSHLDRAHFQRNHHLYLKDIAACIFSSVNVASKKHRIAE